MDRQGVLRNMVAKLFVCLVSVCLFCVGCGTSPSGTPMTEKDPLPKGMTLEFSPVAFKKLVEQNPEMSWSRIRSIPFGSFEDNPIVFHVYKEPEPFLNRDVLRGVFEIKGKHYTLPLEFEISNTLLQEQSEPNSGHVYLIQRDFLAKGGPFYIAGGVPLFANGPSLVLYLIYDRTDDNWKVFDEWGTPYVHDLDSDGNDELMIEFPGMHLHPPNVILFSITEKGRFASAAVVTDQLSNDRRVLAKLNRDSKPWLIHVELEEGIAQYYRYKDKTLTEAKINNP
jgi:hypothetical protein